MSPEFVKRHSGPVPRYTSYPTAPHFSEAVGPEQYAAWLAALPAHANLSLYFHIPFCNELCWYCGCSTRAVCRYEPVAEYLGSLTLEMAEVSRRVPHRHEVNHIHWGGGSPNVLNAQDILSIAQEIRCRFNISEDAEFAVEVDPRELDDERIAAFADAGVTRVSIGVQDFDPKVQVAINRVQSFDNTKRVVDSFRSRGITAINIDLVYGLPHQTRESVADTIDKVLSLEPSRIAIFGYAHLPSRLKHQRLIEEEALPDVVERFGQSSRLARILAAAGYVRIGLDHFARPGDPLAMGRVNRNFQGYTTDVADALIGLGASSIGRLPQGYVQNAVPTADYVRRIGEHGLATVRGIALSADDRARGFVIERLMCDLSFSASEVRGRFGKSAAPIIEVAEALIETDQDDLIEPNEDGFRVTPRGRPFVRSIAACFDTYLDNATATHSLGV